MIRTLPLLLLLLALAALPTTALAQGGTPAPQAPPTPPAAAPPAAGVTVPSSRTLYSDGHVGRFLLDGPWHFRLDPEAQGLRNGFHRQASLEGWSPIQVPHAWNAADLSDESQRGTIGWYRKDFRLPRAARGVSWKIRFESVNYRASVYLNGRLVGKHEFAYVPFEVPAERLSRTGVNRLVVRVSNRRTGKDLPAARSQLNGRPGGGWWNDGGLLREVYLRRVDRVDLEEVLARPTLPCRDCDASVLVRARVRNASTRTRKVAVRASVGGHSLRLRTVELRPGATQESSGQVKVENPRLWEPGDPELYEVQVAAQLGRSTAARYATHIGIRSFEVNRRGRLVVNGRPARLRGAAMHEDVPGRGAALTPEDRVQNMTLLQQLGATATRSHYPLHPHTLEMADRAGIVVWDEIPFNRLKFQVSDDSQLKEDNALRLEAVRNKGLRYLEDMIRRDQNHASVAIWSIANELESRPERTQEEYIANSVRLAKRLDPTRLTALAFAAYPQLPAFPIYRRLDVLGVNSYFGWYVGTAGGLTDRERLGPYLDQLHRYYPTEAIFVSEFGAEANRPGPVDEKGSYAFQSDFIRFHLGVYDSKPFVSGATAWILRDFRVQPGWDGGNFKPEPPWNHKGLVDRYGTPKPAFEEARRHFRNIEPLG